MKVLWIVNTVFPFPAKVLGLKDNISGWWTVSLAEYIKQKVELAVVCFYKGCDMIELMDNHIKYFLIPGKLEFKYSNKYVPYYNYINKVFQPDIVHLNGTEYANCISYFNSNNKGKVVTSMQGVMQSIAIHYLDGLTNYDIISNITIRDIIKFDNLYLQKMKYQKAAISEQKIIRLSDAVIGRTNYDFCYTRDCKRYFHCDELMRPSFFNKNWSITNIENHSIFCSQGSYPVKGLHILLKALCLLKLKYPDIKLYIAGLNITDCGFKKTGYSNQISKFINKNNLRENVIFTGYLNEKQLLNRLLKTNVFVLPSSVENSSNSLCEATLLGMPCVVSYSGGTPDIVDTNQALFYQFADFCLLAERIDRIFSDKTLAVSLGKNAKLKAMKRHDANKISNTIINIYMDILEGQDE